MAGVMLDALPNPQNATVSTTATAPLPWMNGVTYDAPLIEAAEEEARDPQQLAAARALWSALDEAVEKKGGQRFERPLRLQALRAAIAAGASPSLVANWRWNLQLWNEADRATWNQTMQLAFPAQN